MVLFGTRYFCAVIYGLPSYCKSIYQYEAKKIMTNIYTQMTSNCKFYQLLPI